jgi:preprotein translocase subunit SecB
MANEIYEFNFTEFRLVSVNFNLKLDKEYKITKELSIATKLSLRQDFIKEHNTLRLFMKVEVDGDDLPFSISIEGGGLFHFKNPVEDMSSLARVANINCASIAFPFLREAVADIVRRSGLPPLNLPPVNFVELYKQNFPDDPIQ